MGSIVAWLRRLSIVLFCCLFAETYLQIFHPVAVIPRNVVSSPFGIRMNLPNHRYWQTSRDYKVLVRTNSKGLRADVEFPYEKPPGVKRIVVLGDSFGMGYEVDLDKTFLAQMQHVLANHSIRTEVINLSVSGHGTAEELIVLQNEGVKYHPDLVLLAWNSTDIEDNIRCALYRVEAGKPVRSGSTYLPGTKINEFLSRIPGYTFVAENSQLYVLIRETVATQMKDLLLDIRSRAPGKASDTANTSSSEHPPIAAIDAPENILSNSLVNALKSTSKAAGAAFLILDIPIQLMPGKFTPSALATINVTSRDFDIVDPIPALKSRCDVPLYWLKYHKHFTPLGSQIVGQTLADTILDRGLLK